MSTLEPSMGLLITTIGVDSGLIWEQNVNANILSIGGHTHQPGSGVQIQPGGLNINTALAFNNNPAINLQATVYSPQASLTTLNAVYFSGVDLYANDGSGNTIQITSGGVVNATSSGISSGTNSAAFVSSTLVVNSNTATPANIQVASVLLGNNVANSNYLTLQPPSAMASNFALTLPSIPAATSFVQLDVSGNLGAGPAISSGITASNIAANTITAGQIAPATITSSQIALGTIIATNLVGGTLTSAQIASDTITVGNMAAANSASASGTSGGFTTSNTSPTQVSNQTAVVPSFNSGRPVFVSFTGGTLVLTATGGPFVGTFTVQSSNGLTLQTAAIFTMTATSGSVNVPCGAIGFIDPTPHGATYHLLANVNNISAAISVQNVKMTLVQV